MKNNTQDRSQPQPYETPLGKTIADDYAAGLSLNQLSEKYNLTVNMVRKCVIASGVPMRFTGYKSKLSDSDSKAAAEMYVTTPATLRDVAKLYGVSETTIHTLAVKYYGTAHLEEKRRARKASIVKTGKLAAIPISLQQANEFIAQHHRHHEPVVRDKFRVACELDGKLVGVAQLARPNSRFLDNGRIIEVVRLCTDGTPDAASFLYSRAARIAREMGYHKIITYILDTESGTSLVASGWHKEDDVRGKVWNRPGKPVMEEEPVNKQRWAKILTTR